MTTQDKGPTRKQIEAMARGLDHACMAAMEQDNRALQSQTEKLTRERDDFAAKVKYHQTHSYQQAVERAEAAEKGWSDERALAVAWKARAEASEDRFQEQCQRKNEVEAKYQASEQARRRLREALEPIAKNAEWALGWHDDVCEKPHGDGSVCLGHRACGIGCDMGGAGPGPKGQHDEGCPIESARKALAEGP